MSEEKKDKAPIDLTHPSIGGRKVGHWVPSNQGKEIDFSSIPGVRCVMPPPSRAETKPAESVETEDEASDHPMFNAKPESKEDDNA